MKKYPKIPLRVHADWHEDQFFVDGAQAWAVETLWAAAKDLPAYEVPLIGMNIDITPWDSVTDDFLTYLSHVKLILDADLSYPVILTPSGVIADGRHRIGKAVVQGLTKISVVRLPYMPEPDLFYNDDGDPIIEEDD
jgi:hypothetical protein